MFDSERQTIAVHGCRHYLMNDSHPPISAAWHQGTKSFQCPSETTLTGGR